MAFAIKNVRNFVADTHAGGMRAKPVWSRNAKQPLSIDVYTFEPGSTQNTHYHPNSSELAICWSGRGRASIALPQGPIDAAWKANPAWQPQYLEIDLAPGDTLVVPKGALHRYEAAVFSDAEKLTLPADKQQTARPGKLLLVMVHAGAGTAKPGALPGTAAPPPQGPQLQKFKRNFRNPAYCHFMRNPELRAVRARIWGKDAQEDDGMSDTAKPSFHLTLYTFVPGQENPEHYHPHSVEFVLCVQGEAKTSIAVQKPHKPNDWQAKQTQVLQAGDMAIVPKAALHRYINSTGKDDLLLLALQSPQPIMHIIRDEIDF
jgi:quercetin dioxygenase-like cupin family protein